MMAHCFRRGQLVGINLHCQNKFIFRLADRDNNINKNRPVTSCAHLVSALCLNELYQSVFMPTNQKARSDFWRTRKWNKTFLLAPVNKWKPPTTVTDCNGICRAIEFCFRNVCCLASFCDWFALNNFCHSYGPQLVAHFGISTYEMQIANWYSFSLSLTSILILIISHFCQLSGSHLADWLLLSTWQWCINNYLMIHRYLAWLHSSFFFSVVTFLVWISTVHPWVGLMAHKTADTNFCHWFFFICVCSSVLI